MTATMVRRNDDDGSIIARVSRRETAVFRWGEWMEIRRPSPEREHR